MFLKSFITKSKNVEVPNNVKITELIPHVSHIRKNNGKTSAPHKVHIIKKETLLTFLEGYSKCQRGLSSCAKFCGWGSCLHILSISSHRTKCQVKASPADAMPLHHPLCCSASEGGIILHQNIKLFLDLLYCVRLPLAEDVVLIPRSKQVLVKFSCV